MLYRSQRELSSETLIAQFGVDTAEEESSTAWPEWLLRTPPPPGSNKTARRFLRSRALGAPSSAGHPRVSAGRREAFPWASARPGSTLPESGVAIAMIIYQT